MELSHQEKLKKSKEEKKLIYADFQKKLIKKKLNLYGFEIHIFDPEDSTTLFNTHRDMYTSACLYFKDIQFGIITPQFSDIRTGNKIIGMHLGRCGKDILDNINYHRSEKGLKEIKVENYHKTLQSCIDEAEKIRKEAVKFYSI